MADVNAVAVVSFVKHWDNDTKGTMETPEFPTLAAAIGYTKTILTSDALEDGVKFTEDTVPDGDLFTITKAAWGVPSNWIGV